MIKNLLSLIKNEAFSIEPKWLGAVNLISFMFVFYIIVRLIYYTFFLNYYEVLHIDERIIINDIYNVWTLDNEFNRYPTIENKLIKNIYLVITEISYGGDLRYGRIWSNIFILLMGPFSLFGDQVLITAVRIFTILIYFISLNILINLFLNKNLRWFYLLIFYSLPGVVYFNSLPKPDPFVIFFLSISFHLLIKKKYYFSVLLFAISTGVKIVGVFALVLAILHLFYTRKIPLNRNSLLKVLLNSWIGIVIANPILIIPPFPIFEIPNFYKIYYHWLDSQSKYDQSLRFSYEYFKNWLETLAIHFTYNLTRSPVIFILFSVFILYILFKFSQKNESVIQLVTLVGFSHLIFIIISIQRQWILYLNYSFIFLIIGIIFFINSHTNKKILFHILLFMIIVPNGLLKINGSLETRQTIPSEDFLTISLVTDKISDLYQIHSKDTKLVYWDPSIGMARNKVTYNDIFQVRENWEGHELEYIFKKSDFYVTKQNLTSDKYSKIEVENFNIYYLDS